MSGFSCTRWLPLALAVLLAAPASAQQTEVFFARKIWPGRGPALENAALVVRDGAIVALGPASRTVVPPGARRHDVDVIIPGLVAVETGLAATEESDRTLTPEHRALDGFDFYEPRHALLAGGVTTVQISAAANRLVAGQGAVVKLAGANAATRTLRDVEALSVVLTRASRTPPSIYEPPVGAVSVDRPLDPASPQVGTSLAGAVAGLRAILKAAEDAAGTSPNAAESAEAGILLNTMAQYLQPGRRWRVAAETPAEILAAMELAGQFRLNVLLVGPERLGAFAGQFDAWKPALAGVVLGPATRPGRITNSTIPSPDQLPESPAWVEARRLRDAGIPVALRAGVDADLDELLYLGGLFLRGGFEPHEVLEMLTAAPAAMLEVDDRVGTLAPGKDADFVVMTDDPFALRTRIDATYIAGAKVYDRERAAKTTVIKAAQVYRGPRDVVPGGAIVVRGSTVRDVGTDVSAPIDADVRRFEGAVVVPGFIDLATGLGLGGPLSGTLPLQTRLGEQLDPADPSVPIARQGGVTTVLLMNSGPAPTPVVAFKLGDQPRVLKDPVAVKFTITGNVTTQIAALRTTLGQGRAYHETWVRYAAAQAEYEKKLKEYEASKAQKAAESDEGSGEASEGGADADSGKPDGASGKDGGGSEAKHSGAQDGEKQDPDEKDPAKKDAEKQDAGKTDESKSEPPKPPAEPRKNDALEPYRAMFEGKIPALVEARRQNHVAAAVELFRDEFKLRLILVGADDLARDPSLASGGDVAVSIGPSVIHTVERQPVNLPQVLANEQIPYGFQSEATTGVRDLPHVVQFAVRKGLGVPDALAGLTEGPARMMAIDDMVGTLASGKSADLVVLSGPPFELATEVLAVMIDGEWVYEKTR